MALIWKTDLQGVHYEVRRAGRTLRLYANGVQHSEFHPKRLLTGSVWDLLWLPALLHEPSRFRRVLVLGLGGEGGAKRCNEDGAKRRHFFK